MAGMDILSDERRNLKSTLTLQLNEACMNHGATYIIFFKLW
jgi:hypothetical protein